MTGLAKSTISERLTFLLEKGLIRAKDSIVSPAIYEVADPAKLSALLQGDPGVLAKATDRFIDLWDF